MSKSSRIFYAVRSGSTFLIRNPSDGQLRFGGNPVAWGDIVELFPDTAMAEKLMASNDAPPAPHGWELVRVRLEVLDTVEGRGDLRGTV